MTVSCDEVISGLKVVRFPSRESDEVSFNKICGCVTEVVSVVSWYPITPCLYLMVVIVVGDTVVTSDCTVVAKVVGLDVACSVVATVVYLEENCPVVPTMIGLDIACFVVVTVVGLDIVCSLVVTVIGLDGTCSVVPTVVGLVVDRN